MARGLAALIVVLGLAAPARADRIVLTQDDPALRRALEASLDAAGIAVEVVVAAAPDATTDTLVASRALSAREDASAVVWILPDDTGASTILVFDREMDRILVRPLAHAPPLDDEDAAAAASMVRTMLRAIRVTPDVDVAPPRAEDAAAVRAAELAPAPPTRPRRRRFEVALGSRAAFGGPRTTAWAVTAGFAWYPGRVGVAVSLAGGPTGAVDGPGFEGRYGDLDAAVMARLPILSAARTTVEVAAGAAVHRTTLEGALMDASVDETRLDPAARVEVAAIQRLDPSFGIVLTVSGDAYLRRQRYLDGADEVVGTPRFAASVGLHLRVTVP